MARPRKPSTSTSTAGGEAPTSTSTQSSAHRDHLEDHQVSKATTSSASTSSSLETVNENKKLQLAETISEARRKSFEMIRDPSKIYRPFLVFLCGYLIQEGLVYLAAPYLEKSLSSVTHDPEGPWVYAVSISKFLESLAVYYGGFDVVEAVFLTLLSRAPTLLFLSTFHPSISSTTLLATLLVATLSNVLPLYFFRDSFSPQHQFKFTSYHQRKKSSESPVDKLTYISTTLLSSSIFASALYTSLKTFLTKYVIVHSFYPEAHVLESVEKVYNTDPITWAAHILPVGVAITDIIFARAINEPATKPKMVESGSPAARIWNGLSPRTKTIVKRTAFVAVYMLVESIVKLGGLVKGGTLEGSAVVGSIWAATTIVNGLVLGWIGME